MSNRMIINIFGPSTAGKTTIANLLQQKIDRLYTVDFDVIKRQLSGYYFKRDRAIATRLTYEMLVSVAQTDLPILALLPPPKSQEEYESIEQVASNTNSTLLNIEITAPDPILVRRYQERLREVTESGLDIKLKTVDEFIEQLKVPYYRPKNTVSFDSSALSPDDIFDKVQALLR